MAGDLAAQLLDTVHRLVAVLETEIEVLRTRGPQHLEPIVGQKQGLLAAYESQVKSLAEQDPDIAASSPDLRQRLGAAAQSLERAVSANRRALDAARLATDQVVHAIAAAVRSVQPQHQHYLADGRLSAAQGGGQAPSVSLNRVL